TDVVVAELREFLRCHAALRTLRAAAVYDDLRVLGQIRAAYFVAHLAQRHPARTENVLTLETTRRSGRSRTGRIVCCPEVAGLPVSKLCLPLLPWLVWDCSY